MSCGDGQLPLAVEAIAMRHVTEIRPTPTGRKAVGVHALGSERRQARRRTHCEKNGLTSKTPYKQILAPMANDLRDWLAQTRRILV